MTRPQPYYPVGFFDAKRRELSRAVAAQDRLATCFLIKDNNFLSQEFRIFQPIGFNQVAQIDYINSFLNPNTYWFDRFQARFRDLYRAIISNDHLAAELCLKEYPRFRQIPNQDGSLSHTVCRALAVDSKMARIVADGNTNYFDQFGNTPLHLVAMFGRENLVEFFADIYDPRTSNKNGLTAFYFAASNQNHQMFNFLARKANDSRNGSSQSVFGENYQPRQNYRSFVIERVRVITEESKAGEEQKQSDTDSEFLTSLESNSGKSSERESDIPRPVLYEVNQEDLLETKSEPVVIIDFFAESKIEESSDRIISNNQVEEKSQQVLQEEKRKALEDDIEKAIEEAIKLANQERQEIERLEVEKLSPIVALAQGFVEELLEGNNVAHNNKKAPAESKNKKTFTADELKEQIISLLNTVLLSSYQLKKCSLLERIINCEEIENFLNLEVRDVNQNTLLSLACQDGNFAIAQHLIEKGVEVKVFNQNGCSPLHYCAMQQGNESFEVAQKIYEKVGRRDKEFLTKQDNCQRDVCHCCCEKDGNEKVFAMTFGNDFYDLTDKRMLLAHAHINNNTKVIKVLLGVNNEELKPSYFALLNSEKEKMQTAITPTNPKVIQLKEMGKPEEKIRE